MHSSEQKAMVDFAHCNFVLNFLEILFIQTALLIGGGNREAS